MAVVGIANTLYAIDGALAPTHAESTNVGEALDFKRGGGKKRLSAQRRSSVPS